MTDWLSLALRWHSKVSYKLNLMRGHSKPHTSVWWGVYCRESLQRLKGRMRKRQPRQGEVETHVSSLLVYYYLRWLDFGFQGTGTHCMTPFLFSNSVSFFFFIFCFYFLFSSGAKETPAEFRSDVMDMLQKFSKNEEKSSRISQPDLY